MKLCGRVYLTDSWMILRCYSVARFPFGPITNQPIATIGSSSHQQDETLFPPASEWKLSVPPFPVFQMVQVRPQNTDKKKLPCQVTSPSFKGCFVKFENILLQHLVCLEGPLELQVVLTVYYSKQNQTFILSFFSNLSSGWCVHRWAFRPSLEKG